MKKKNFELISFPSQSQATATKGTNKRNSNLYVNPPNHEENFIDKFDSPTHRIWRIKLPDTWLQTSAPRWNDLSTRYGTLTDIWCINQAIIFMGNLFTEMQNTIRKLLILSHQTLNSSENVWDLNCQLHLCGPLHVSLIRFLTKYQTPKYHQFLKTMPSTLFFFFN